MPESGFGVVKQGLTKKIGPLQAWQWGLVAGAGYIAYRVISGKGWSLSGDAAETATSEAAYPAGTGGGYTIMIESQPVSPASGSTSEAAKPTDVSAYLEQIEDLQGRVDYYKQGKLAQKKRAANWKKVATRKATKKASRKVAKRPKTKRRQTAVRNRRKSLVGTAAFHPKQVVTPAHRANKQRPASKNRRDVQRRGRK